MAATVHPLDPLTKQEIEAAVLTLRAAGKVNGNSRFPQISLQEPRKDQVLRFQPGDPVRREAFVVVYERAANRTFEAVVDLTRRAVVSWKEVPGVQPSFMFDDYKLIQEIVRSDPGWQAAIRKRGVTDFDRVQIDPWSAGDYGLPGEKGVRIFRAIAHYKANGVNAYARPIEGVAAYVDLNAKKVMKLVDTGVVPLAKDSAELDPRSIGKLREAPKPLRIEQPRGPSFVVEGNDVRWQNWRFRFGMHPREGLVLYTVGYEDNGKLRSVLYRASLSEMIVPYGDPGAVWFFRNVFDEGEYGLGQMIGSLEPLADAPPNARFFDMVLADDRGAPVETPRAAALYEIDGGVLWKHLDFDSRRNESRRARRLVLFTVATVGNYDYGLSWIFHQDGTLEMDMQLTGIMQPKGVSLKTDPGHDHPELRHAHLVAPYVAAVHHQHFFNFRLDLDVDGPSGNSVAEWNTEALPAGPENPHGGAFVMKETVLRRELEAQRHMNLATGRRWRVFNSSSRNALGQPAGYLLVPGENALPYLQPGSSARKRAGFLNAHLWVTPYEAAEMNAAGFYINQNAGGEGLPHWTRANRSIENRDVVVWYTMGVTHLPRPEEWPVMAVHHAGFKLLPSSFFARNPSLEVPKPE
jgi:primary-amine oxidase